MTLIYGLIPPMAGRNRVKPMHIKLFRTTSVLAGTMYIVNIYHRNILLVKISDFFFLERMKFIMMEIATFFSFLGVHVFVF